MRFSTVPLLWLGTGLRSLLAEGRFLQVSLECGPGLPECPSELCCSAFNLCGTTDDFCGPGCQPDFGDCDEETPIEEPAPTPGEPSPAPVEPTPAPEDPTPAPEEPTPAPEEPAPTPEPTPAPEEPAPTPEEPTPAPEESVPIPEESEPGLCGTESGSCDDWLCCSGFGVCGYTFDFCGPGCQRDFGLCIKEEEEEDRDEDPIDFEGGGDAGNGEDEDEEDTQFLNRAWEVAVTVIGSLLVAAMLGFLAFLCRGCKFSNDSSGKPPAWTMRA